MKPPPMLGQGPWKEFATIFLVTMVWGIQAGPAISTATISPQTPPGQSDQPSGTRYSPGVADVVKMVDAKVDTGVIDTFIDNSPVSYNLRADEIIALKDHGVPQPLIAAMIERGAVLREERQTASQPVWQGQAQAPQRALPQAPAQEPAPASFAPDAASSSVIYSSPGYAQTIPVYEPVYTYPYYYGYPYSYGWYGYPWCASYTWWWPYWGYCSYWWYHDGHDSHHNYCYRDDYKGGYHHADYHGKGNGPHDGRGTPYGSGAGRDRAATPSGNRMVAGATSASRSPFAPAVSSRTVGGGAPTAARAVQPSRPTRSAVATSAVPTAPDSPGGATRPNQVAAAGATSATRPAVVARRVPSRTAPSTAAARTTPQSFASANAFAASGSTRVPRGGTYTANQWANTAVTPQRSTWPGAGARQTPVYGASQSFRGSTGVSTYRATPSFSGSRQSSVFGSAGVTRSYSSFGRPSAFRASPGASSGGFRAPAYSGGNGFRSSGGFSGGGFRASPSTGGSGGFRGGSAFSGGGGFRGGGRPGR